MVSKDPLVKVCYTFPHMVASIILKVNSSKKQRGIFFPLVDPYK